MKSIKYNKQSSLSFIQFYKKDYSKTPQDYS
jgi:hypothetical protein